MAKSHITNVHVDNVSIESGTYAIGWTIGADRYHTWFHERSGLSETIFKNPPLYLKQGEAGYYDTRRLKRESTAQATAFAEVMKVVDTLGLVDLAFRQERAKIAAEDSRNELQHAIDAIEQEALEAFRDGWHDLRPNGFREIWTRWRNVRAQLDALPGREAA